MNGLNEYFNIVTNKLTELVNDQQEVIHTVARELKDIISQDGIIYLFGCGHSHIFGEDVFYRAGGLAAVRPMLIEPLMLHQGAALSSKLEKKNNFVNDYLDAYPLTARDAVIVISTSGINPAPIDVALWAKEAQALSVGITSLAYAERYPSRHPCGLHLSECTDLVIDNHVPIGDAVLTLGDQTPPFAPISSMMGIFILQSLFAQTACYLQESNLTLPIFLSGNIPGSDENNNKLLCKYGDKIPELIKGL